MATAQGDAPSQREKALEKLKIDIRSILITAKKGSTVQELQMDFEDLNGRPIPTRELGFRDLEELILSMPDVVQVTKENGRIKLYPKSHESTRRIESLIQRTKTTRVTRFGGTEQRQPSAEQLRITNERRRVIKERMIQIASRTRGFIAFSDLRRQYRATFREDFDAKADFKCPPKVVFSAKWNRHFVVVGRGALEFQVRLRETTYTELESRGSASGFGGSAPRSFNQQNQPRSARPAYTGNQNRPPSGYNAFGGNQASYNSAARRQPTFGADIPPRFANAPQRSGQMASTGYQSQVPPRFGGSAAENMPRPSTPAQTSTVAPSIPKSNLSVTISNTGQSVRSVSMSHSTMQEQQQKPRASPPAYTRPSTAALKNRISELLAKYSNGIELVMFKDIYFYHFKQECGVGTEFLRECCNDICEIEWNECSLRHIIKPKPSIKDPLSTMPSVAAALPLVSRPEPKLSSATSSASARLPPPAAAVPSTSSSVPTHSLASPLPSSSAPSPLSWEDLKNELRLVLQNYPSGISYLAFPKAYRVATGRELDLEQYKLWSLTELIEALPDVFLTLKCSGEVMLYDAAGQDQSISSFLQSEVKDMDHLADEIWALAMNAPNQSLLLAKIPEAYQSAFGKPIPAKDFDGDVSIKLFDYMDRFEFVYEGVVYLKALPDYKPSEDAVRSLIKKKDETKVAGASLFTDHVSLGEKFIYQTLPERVTQLVSLDDAELNRQFEVYVAQVESPARFFVQLRSAYSEFEALVGEMNDFYLNVSKAARISAAEVKVGMPCACYYDDGLWYRSLIKAVDGDHVTVSLVDYGTDASVPVDALCYLARKFFSFPAQAIECCLAYLTPVNETWLIEAGEIMAEFCGSSVLTAELIKIEGGILHVYLTKRFEDGTDTYLNDVLLDANLAAFNEAEMPDTDENDSAVAVAGSTNDLDDGASSGAENSSAVSFRTAPDDGPSAVDVSSPYSTPQGLEFEMESILDLSFEENVVNQLRSGDLNDADSEVVNLASIILRRKLVALRKKLNGESSNVSDLIVDKVSWLEQQIHWLSEQLSKMD